jgi:hypothetical protein
MIDHARRGDGRLLDACHDEEREREEHRDAFCA